MVKYLQLGELSSNVEFTTTVKVRMPLVRTERLIGVSASSSGVNLEFNW